MYVEVFKVIWRFTLTFFLKFLRTNFKKYFSLDRIRSQDDKMLRAAGFKSFWFESTTQINSLASIWVPVPVPIWLTIDQDYAPNNSWITWKTPHQIPAGLPWRLRTKYQLDYLEETTPNIQWSTLKTSHQIPAGLPWRLHTKYQLDYLEETTPNIRWSTL